MNNQKYRASMIARLVACPGSIRYVESEGVSGAADAGRRIHALLAGDEADLSEFEQWTAARCKSFELSLLADMQITPTVEMREQSGSIRSSHITLTGSADVQYYDVEKNILLIIDYKTGRLGASSAAANWQLLAYALIFGKNYPNAKVYACIIQPNAEEKQSVVEFSPEYLLRAKKQLFSELKKVRPDAERKAGEDHCKYCPGLGQCSVARESVLPVVKKAVELADILESKTGEQLGEFLTASAFAVKVIDAVKAEVKKRLSADPASVPGFKLGKPRVQRKVQSVTGAREKLGISYLTDEEYYSACSVSIPELIKVLAGKTGVSEKVAEETVIRQLGDVLTITESQPSLVKDTRRTELPAD
jgi:CRISPR/Cas system-associated exonuclease Cas4 (RecB family)